MKKYFFVLPVSLILLISCGGETTATPDNQALNEIPETQDDFVDAAVSFEEGGATTGEEYFVGVQAEVVEIDIKLREVDNLDEMNATEAEFASHYDTLLAMIQNCKAALDLYAGKDWPKRQELHDLTIEWVDAVAFLINEHLKPLAKAMSVSDDQWTKSENAQYDKYTIAYDEYIEVDNKWIDFQEVFAAANGFELSEEGIDIDALVEEDMEAKEH